MKYALIGCGRIAVNHMKAAINNKLEIVAVCDVLPEKMEALLEKYDLQNDPSIKRYTDYKQMLAENDITLASIATESGIHAQIALYCIDHGVNVIIEKPMAMSMDDAEEIVRRSLNACGSPCDGCNGCGNAGGGRIDAIYQPYIDGEKELADINAEYAASRKLIR